MVRLLDLVSAALEATANGAQARIQLELVLVKATAPEVDPSTAALLARIERLEAALAGGRGAPPGAPHAPRPALRPPPPAAAARAAAPPAAPAPAAGPAGRRPAEQPAAAHAGRPASARPRPPAPAGARRPARAGDLVASWPAVIDVVRQEQRDAGRRCWPTPARWRCTART